MRATAIAVRQAQAIEAMNQQLARIEALLTNGGAAVEAQSGGQLPAIVIQAANPDEARAAAESFMQQVVGLMPLHFQIQSEAAAGESPAPSTEPEVSAPTGKSKSGK